jgi:hypothetical protein
MTPIGQSCMCEPMTWLYFVFVQSVLVFVGQTLAVVPAPVIARFLEGVLSEDGRSPQLPSLGVHLQLLNSPSLRKYLKMKDTDTGVMVTHVEHGREGCVSL